jgi:hypothetical protein
LGEKGEIPMRILTPIGRSAVLLLVCWLALSLAVAAYAQGEGDGPRDEEIGSFGLDDPPPAGYSVLYTFTGATNYTTAGKRIATVVMCTNYGSSPLNIRVEMFSYGGAGMWFKARDVNPSTSPTFSSQDTNIFFDDEVLATGTLNQGSGRVLATGSRVICTALLVDPDSDQPSFMAGLALYDGNGNPVHGSAKTFLPAILKNA